MDSTLFFYILITILFSAFFSGIEIAFITANKLRIELENKQGKFPARILSFFIRKPSRFIGAMLLGNNIALVMYGIFMAALLEPGIEFYITENRWLVLLIQTITSTIIILFTAEFLPKALFRIDPHRVLNLLAVPTALIYFILWIPMIILIGISEGILRIFARDNDGDGTDVGLGRIDLDHYLEEVTQSAAKNNHEIDQEVQIFRNALDFSNIKVRDCMVPRTEMIAINVDSEIEALRSLFVETQLSKIFVYRDSIDNIIGYVHSYELFKQPQSIQNILLPVAFVPESQQAQTVLEEFTRQSRSIAVVVDEFGGTSGLVTIEDIIEEIFGEIEDEHDTEEHTEQRINENEFLFAGRLEIDYLNETYQLNIPYSDEYETLAGYLINHLQDIPEKYTRTTIGQYDFVVESVSGQRIETVRVIKS